MRRRLAPIHLRPLLSNTLHFLLRIKTILQTCRKQFCWPKWNFVFTEASCPTYTLLTSSSGTIRGPGWPGSYPNNALKCWRIYAPTTNHMVKLKINTLNLEACSRCSCDSIEVFDGADVYSTSLGKFCTGSWSLNSSSRYLYVMFTSDSARTGNAFTVTYNTERKGKWDLRSFLHHDWRTSKTMLRFRVRLFKR